MQTDIRRRSLLLGGISAPLALRASPHSSAEWSNWSGSVRSAPRWRLYPRSTAELQAALAVAPGPLRPLGAGQSWAPLAATEGTQIDLRGLHGLVGWNESLSRVRVRAGTRLADLSALLETRGSMLPVLGHSLDMTLAGALATGSYGGLFGASTLSSQVTALQLLTPGGEILEVSEREHPEWLPALACSLGALGILTEVELQLRPSTRLRDSVQRLGLSEALGQLQSAQKQVEQCSLLVFPYSDVAYLRQLRPTASPPTEVAQAELPWREWMTQLGHQVPPLDAPLQSLYSLLQWSEERVVEPQQLHSPWQRMRYHALEYVLPAAEATECLLSLRSAIRQAELNLMLPLELNALEADAAWISPCYRRPAVAIALRQWVGADAAPLFALAEPILRRFGGRPHWASAHSLGAAELAQLYPRWEDFQSLRAELDPQGRMLSPALRQLLLPA